MTMPATPLYQSIYTGGLDAYHAAIDNDMDVVISLIEVKRLPAQIHHIIAPLTTCLTKDYQQAAIKIFALLDLSLKKDWRVLVHCQLGEMRSQGVVRAYAKHHDPKTKVGQTPFSSMFLKMYFTAN